MNFNFLIRIPQICLIQCRRRDNKTSIPILLQIRRCPRRNDKSITRRSSPESLTTDLYATDFRRAQYKSFLDILQARCLSFDMRSTTDYRKTNMDEPTG